MLQELAERAKAETVVQGGTGGNSLEAQLHLKEGQFACFFLWSGANDALAGAVLNHVTAPFLLETVL